MRAGFALLVGDCLTGEQEISNVGLLDFFGGLPGTVGGGGRCLGLFPALRPVLDPNALGEFAFGAQFFFRQGIGERRIELVGQ